jgi:DNA polymerase III delta prime subunit
MARMIPATIDPETPSPGERDVFHRLEADRLAEAWIVIHSLNLPHHQRQISGELDFVVLIPEKGILCLEIKAARTVARRGGLWFYGRDEKGDPRGPFRQASDGMHSLRERLARRRPESTRVVFWSAVVFPYTTFTFEPEEWHWWQVIDSGRYRAGSFAASCEEIVDRARALLATKPSAQWFDPGAAFPDAHECQRIAAVLRPDFEFFQSPKARRAEKAAEIKHYTEEQFSAIDAMCANRRVVFEGPAGTGKTLLAIEAARRAVASRKRTLFVCFNRLLGSWLRDETTSVGNDLTAGTLHAQMLSLAGIVPPRDAPASFWEDELPQRALEALLEEEGAETFDILIADEAQDLLRDAYLDVLDLSLAGGLATGEWRIFGDFERQAIYDAATVSVHDFLAQRSGGAPTYRLRTNCRNTPRIATLARLLAKLEPDYARVLRPDDGVEPDVHFYRDDDDAPRALIGALDELRRSGYRGRDVVVLSTRAGGSSAERLTDPPWSDRLRPMGRSSDGRTPYTTIHAFKGLEAPAVVVTDVSEVSGDTAEALFYVAVTRPTERLVMLLAESARPAIVAALLHNKAAPQPANA